MTIKYKSYKVFWKASKYNSRCRPCFYLSLDGHTHSEETKQKIGIANSISLIGNIPSNKGRPMSKHQKQLLSAAHVGKKVSDETRQKHRKNQLLRLEKDGIPLNEDRGARRFFEDWNKTHDSNFKPKTFWQLGYVADGYDPILHEWIEFDPPHHYYVNGELKDKDKKRQGRIIQYFEQIGNPLKKFIRVKATKQGSVLSVNNIYGGCYGS